MSKDDPAVRDEMEKIIGDLKRLIVDSKKSLRTWAKIIEITPSALSEILKGSRDPRLSTYLRVKLAVLRRIEEE